MIKATGKKRGDMMNQALIQAIKHWGYIAPLVKRPKNNRDFDKLTSQLDALLEIVDDNERHPLMGLVDVLSNLIANYEEEHFRDSKAKGIDALKYLMESHHLTQSDFPEIASQGVMSEILRGKRLLNLRQVKLLAQRFHVDPSTFINED